MARRRVASLAAALGVGTLAAGTAWAAFAATTSNPASTITAAPDWTPPTASTSVVARSSGCSPTTPGYVKQGGSYHVYALVSDTGNPASGVAAVAADASALTAAQTAATLASGAFSVGGVSYTHRTSALTADPVVAAGSKAYSLTSTDVATNARVQPGYSVMVDNTAPTGTDIDTANVSGGTIGRMEPGDSLIFTTAEPLEPCSVLSGWSGAATAVRLLVTNAGAADTAAVWNVAQTVQLPFGSIALNADVVNGNTVFEATMSSAGTVITVTLGALVSGNLRNDNKTTPPVWTPSATPYDRAQNALSVAPVVGTRTGLHF